MSTSDAGAAVISEAARGTAISRHHLSSIELLRKVFSGMSPGSTFTLLLFGPAIALGTVGLVRYASPRTPVSTSPACAS